MRGTGGESQLVSCGMGLEQKISWRPEDQWEEAGEGRVLVSFKRGMDGESAGDQRSIGRKLERRVSWTRRPVEDS